MKSIAQSFALAFLALASIATVGSAFSVAPKAAKLHAVGLAAASAAHKVRNNGKIRFPLSKRLPVAFSSATNDDDKAIVETASTTDDDEEDQTSSLLSFLVFDAIVATKQLALNWGFVLQSGITKIIGGSLALLLPMLATELALNAIAISLAVISTFNIILGFQGQGGKFKVQSFTLGGIQAFLSYRILYYPFRSLRVLTTLVASACIADGLFETIVSIQNADLPGRWTLLFSGLASMVGGAFVAVNIGVSSLFVLGVLLGSNLLSSGLSSIRAALVGREIANRYLMKANFEGDVADTVADAIDI